MPNPKRVFLAIVRCIPVVLALAFLAFYVARARVNRSPLFSSSKNARAIADASDQWFLENAAKDPRVAPPVAPPPPPTSPPISSPPVSSLPAETINDAEAVSDPFLIGVLSERPVTLGGSKSGVPVVESSDFIQLWLLRPKTAHQIHELPPVHGLPKEPAFSAPSIDIHVGPVDPQLSGAPSPREFPPPTPDRPAPGPQPPTPPSTASSTAPIHPPAPSPEP